MSKTQQTVEPGARAAFINTYQPSTWFGRNAYRAAIMQTADGGVDIDTKYLVSLMNEANKVMRDLEKNANDVTAKMKAEYISAKVAIEASNNNIIKALQETAGKDRRQIVESVQAEMQSIRSNMTTLNKVNRFVIDMPLTQADREFQKALAAGMDQGAAGQIAWEVAVNTITELGMASEGNPELPTLIDTMEARYGPVEKLADNTVKHNAARLKDVAQQAEQQRILMRRRLDGDMGELESIVKDLEKTTNLEGDLAKARDEAAKLKLEHNELADMLDPESAGAQRDLLLMNSDTYNQSKETYDWTREMLLKTGGADGDRLKMAQLLNNPQFRQWAESNGFDKLGTAEFNDDGSVKWIRPGPRDAFAIHVYASQLSTNPLQPIRFHNTRQWARVEINGDALSAKVNGSAYQELLGDNMYATLKDPETGEVSYVGADVIDDILSKNLPSRPPGSLVSYIAPDNVPYIIDPATEKVYAIASVEGQGKIWREVKRKPEDIGLADFKNPPGVIVLQNNGSGKMATVADIDRKPYDGVTRSEQSEKEQAALARAELTKAGISLTNEPPKTPTYVRYGKVMPMHASDAPGSIRIRGPNGREDEYIPPEKVGNVTITRQGSKTNVFDAVSKIRGMRDAEKAKAGVGLAPEERQQANFLDRGVASVTPMSATRTPEMKVRPGMEGINPNPIETNPMSEVVEGFDAPGYAPTYANPTDTLFISKRKQAMIEKAANADITPRQRPQSAEPKVGEVAKPELAPKPTEEPAETAPDAKATEPASSVTPTDTTSKKTDEPTATDKTANATEDKKMKTLAISSMDLARAGLDPADYREPGKVSVPSYEAMLVRRGQKDRAERLAKTMMKPVDEALAEKPVSTPTQTTAASVTAKLPPASDQDRKRAAVKAEIERWKKSGGWDKAAEDVENMP